MGSIRWRSKGWKRRQTGKKCRPASQPGFYLGNKHPSDTFRCGVLAEILATRLILSIEDKKQNTLIT